MLGCCALPSCEDRRTCAPSAEQHGGAPGRRGAYRRRAHSSSEHTLEDRIEAELALGADLDLLPELEAQWFLREPSADRCIPQKVTEAVKSCDIGSPT
ncbi:hypothetical protein FHR33_002926 [Nonomuraea dietziae]|uniref:Uncharacterized protein n=1 Tax=Nonomuraea dietziae TaxID=65515 RepID=A0A7W5UYJ4_9ACTN|nr:hypothetical protein [Nonomuraea dietziae]